MGYGSVTDAFQGRKDFLSRLIQHLSQSMVHAFAEQEHNSTWTNLETGISQYLMPMSLYCLTVPMFGLDIHKYKNTHMDHHRYMMQEKDPDSISIKYLYEKSRIKTLLYFLLVTSLSLIGVGYILSFLGKVALGSLKTKLFLMTSGLVIMWGLIEEIYLIEIIILYWIVPFAAWGAFINSLRAMAEHYPYNSFDKDVRFSQQLRTRDVTLPLQKNCFFPREEQTFILHITSFLQCHSIIWNNYTRKFLKQIHTRSMLMKPVAIMVLFMSICFYSQGK